MISLQHIADARVNFFKTLPITNQSVHFIFEAYYTSTLELLHACVLSKGYTVENHICLGLFLRDSLKRTDLYKIFNECRIKRNSLVYYGTLMPEQTIIKSLEKLEFFMSEISKCFSLC